MKKIVTLMISLLAVIALSVQANTAKKGDTSNHNKRHHLQASFTAPVNLNQATADQIATLKGIGPKRAAEIVAYRQQHGPFQSVDQLANLHGFSKNSVAKLLKKNTGRIVVKAKS